MIAEKHRMPSRLTACLLICVAGMAGPAVGADVEKPALEQTDVFVGGSDGYHTYRIPALVVAADGTLLAFCEGRKTSSSDAGDIDLLLKRSSDGGRTWSGQQIVHEEGGDAKITIGNPAPVVDRATGRIHMLFCRDNSQAFYTSSDDNGRSWSPPREISDSIHESDFAWQRLGTGPGHAIQLQRGPHRGRLAVPVWLNRREPAAEYRTAVAYSDDGGRSWHVGDTVGTQSGNLSEATLLERSDGQLLIDIRVERPRPGKRAEAVSQDGGEHWAPPATVDALAGPGCQASIFGYEPADQPGRMLVLFSNPADPAKRIKMTARLSYDEGRTWPVAREINAGPSAYSSIVALPDGTIGCLYECGERRFSERIRLARFSIDWLTGKADPAPLGKVQVAPGGRTFQTAADTPFVPLGVNYYRPGTGWAPQLWKQFDADATRRDFDRMKSLGVNCVRVFLTYGSFFSEPDALDPQGLAKFDELLRIAEAAGIYVHPTGPDHWEGLPEWARPGGFADEPSLSALETFWKLMAARYRGRNVIFAYDLRNEPSVPWDTPGMRARWNQWLQARYGSADKLAAAWGVMPDSVQWGRQPPPDAKGPAAAPLVDYQHFREEIADEWTRRQAAAIRSADPDALVTVGMIQWSVPVVLPGPRQYSAFRPGRQAPFLDFMEIHFYPLAAGFFEYSPQDEARNLAYLEAVVGEVAAVEKPVVVAEFGWYGGGTVTTGGRTHPAASDDDQARWCRRLVETTEGLATGWLNWGFYDQPEARDVSQRTGLLTADGKPKAWAEAFRQLAGRLSGQTIPPRQLPAGLKLNWERAIVDPAAGRAFLDEVLAARGKADAP